MTEKIEEKVAGVFNQLASAIESGEFGEKQKIGLTMLGSEHGLDELKEAAEIAENNYSELDVTLIGCGSSECDCLADSHQMMDDMLEAGDIDAAVTLHYSFPMGVSIVGRVV